MSFVMFAIVGLSVGVVIHVMAMERLPIGLLGSLLLGLGSAFAGGLLGAGVAGYPVTVIRPATVAGTAFGAYGAVALVAILAHFKHTRGDLHQLLRRIRR